MIPGIDTRRGVNLMIREHGENAALEAAPRSDAMLERPARRRVHGGLAPHLPRARRETQTEPVAGTI